MGRYDANNVLHDLDLQKPCARAGGAVQRESEAEKGPLKAPNLILIQYPRGWDFAIGLDPLLVDDQTAYCMQEQAASES